MHHNSIGSFSMEMTIAIVIMCYFLNTASGTYQEYIDRIKENLKVKK